jgi:hypothetical protein
MTRPYFIPFILKSLSIGSLVIALAVVWHFTQRVPELATISEKNPPTTKTIESSVPSRSIHGPDERILWQLFNAGKLTSLQKLIAQWQKQFSNWQPPVKLLSLMHVKNQSRLVSNPIQEHHALNQSLRSKNIDQIISLILSQPNQQCSQLLQLWDNNSIFHHLKSQADKLKLLTATIRLCKSSQDRLNLIQSAQSYLDTPHFNHLIQAILPLFHNPDDLYRIETIQYYKNRYFLSQSMTENNASNIKLLLPLLSSLIKKHKDVAVANQLGWYFLKHDRAASINWFRNALNWQPQHIESAIGLIQALHDNQQNTQALNLALQYSKNPKIQPLLANLLLAQAQKLYDEQDYQKSLDSLQQARLYLSEQRPANELNAWLLWKMGRSQKALQMAAQDQPQSEGMQKLMGIIYLKKAWQLLDQENYTQAQASLDRAIVYSGATPESDKLSAWLDYKQIPQKYSYPELFAYKEFLAANQFAPAPLITPDITPNVQLLKNIDSAFIEAGTLYRSKSGDTGTSRLEIKEIPLIGGRYVFAKSHEFSLHAFRSELYSGRVSEQDCRSIGSIGLTPNSNQLKPCFSPFTNSLSNGLYTQLNYHLSGRFSPYFSIGSTPTDGILNPTLTWTLGFRKHSKRGFWEIEGFSEPIRQSILSYTGMKDPYSHEQWGRVSSTGLKATALVELSQHWNIYSQSKAAFLSGTKVADNMDISQSISFGYNFHLKHFDYFTLGPSGSIQHYNKNLSHFTLGHGGYFSPQLFYNIGASLNFLTEEGKSFIIKGLASAGVQSFTESQSSYFPTNSSLQNLAEKNLQNNGIYSKNSELGATFDLELKGAWLLSSNIQIAGGGGFRKTGNYSDYFFAANIRYYFNNRSATFSTDIPDFSFKQLF